MVHAELGGVTVGIRPIRNDEDLTAALHRIDVLWGAAEGGAAGDELDILLALVERYEDTRHPLPPPAPASVFLREYLALSGRTQADLALLLGSRSRASEILAGRRPLTLDQIRRLAREWRIPADLLLDVHTDIGAA